jgi:hypothetical protein
MLIGGQTYMSAGAILEYILIVRGGGVVAICATRDAGSELSRRLKGLYVSKDLEFLGFGLCTERWQENQIGVLTRGQKYI